MQAEEDSIELVTLDRSDDRIAKPLERRALYLATRCRRRAEDMFDLPAMCPAGIEEACELCIRLASSGDGLFSNQNVTIPECLFAGPKATECVRLMREFCSEDPECHQ